MSTTLNAELTKKIAQYRTELEAVNCAILRAIGQPVTVSIQGSVSYTNRPLPELYQCRRDIERIICGLTTGTPITRTLPRYWRTQGNYPV